MIEEVEALPWQTPPSGQGSEICEWCHREIYRPALPCSEHPVEGLLQIETKAGQGERCKFELSTRKPELLNAALPR